MSVPKALQAAYDRLVKELDRCITDTASGKQISRRSDLFEAVRRFVVAFGDVPGGMKKLETRAEWIEKHCGPGSDYDRAATAALGIPDAPDGLLAMRAFDELDRQHFPPAGRLGENHNEPGGPQWLDELTQTQGRISKVRAGFPRNEDGGLSESEELFRAWQKTCNRIVDGAWTLEPDGCRYLRHLWDVKSADADCSQVISRYSCESMRTAADSLLGWAAAEWKRLRADIEAVNDSAGETNHGNGQKPDDAGLPDGPIGGGFRGNGQDHHGLNDNAGHLELIVDFDHQTVKRVGHDPVVDFRGCRVAWHTFKVFYEAKESDAVIDVWQNNYPGEWGSRRQNLAELRTKLIPLGVTIPDRCRRLIDDGT